MYQSQSGQDCSVFAKTQPDVRKGFWRRVAGETRRRFCSVSNEARAAGKQSNDYRKRRTRMTEHLNCQKGATDGANNGVHSVPGRIEPRDFVGQKFEQIENARDGDHERMSKDLERLILRRQRDPMEMNGQTGGEDGQVKIQSGKGRQSQCDAKQI